MLIGTPAADTIHGLGGADLIVGMGGNDTVDGGSGDDRVYGSGGRDLIYGGTGTDRIWGERGDDRISGGTGQDIIDGGDGNDRLWGDQNDDTIHGGAGADRIWGGDGRDILYAAQETGRDVGVDVLHGGGGADLVLGTTNDVLHGDAGDDSLGVLVDEDARWEHPGSATAFGGAGNDLLYVDQPYDDPYLVPPSISAVFYGEDGDDSIGGSFLGDRLYGGSGDDVIVAHGGNDLVLGGAGKDLLRGGEGDDRLYGGDGNDVLDGGNGRDQLTGGAGQDIVQVSLRHEEFPTYQNAPEANDLVKDFTRGMDRLSIDAASYDDGFQVIASHHVTFGELDTNHDGRLNAPDQAVTIANVTLDGVTSASTIIDVARITPVHDMSSAFFGTITLFGATNLQAGDIA